MTEQEPWIVDVKTNEIFTLLKGMSLHEIMIVIKQVQDKINNTAILPLGA